MSVLASLALLVVQVAHATYVAFVLVGPAFVLLSARAPVRLAKVVRASHLGVLVFIAFQYGLDWPCPLTRWENLLAGRPANVELIGGLDRFGEELFAVVAVYVLASVAAHVAAHRYGSDARGAVRRASAK